MENEKIIAEGIFLNESRQDAEKSDKETEIYEMPERRSANSRVFKMKDGSERAVIYSSDKYYFNSESGDFEEISNELEMSEDEKYFVNSKKNFLSKFSNDSSNDEIFTIEKGKYSLAVFANTERGEGLFRRAPKLTGTVMKSKHGIEHNMVEYADMKKGVSMLYSVKNDGIKEDIIIMRKLPSYKHLFVIKTKNLEILHHSDSTKLSFVDKESKAEIFTIPAPFMSDAEGNVSTAVFYETKQLTEDKLVLTVLPDEKWINAEERAFPVTIDPQIKVSSELISTYNWHNNIINYGIGSHKVGMEMVDASLYPSAMPSNNNGDDEDCATCVTCAKRMYVKLCMPEISKKPRIKKAELKFYQQAEYSELNSSMPLFGLYKVNGEIALGEDQTSIGDLVDVGRMAYRFNYKEPREYSFDITSLFDEASQDDSTVNLAVKLINETYVDDCYIYLNGTESSEYQPELVITYDNNYSVGTDYRASTHNIGRFGEASIDLKYGILNFESEDFAWSGNRMPVSVRHLFTSVLAGYKYTNNETICLNTADFSAMNIGAGWKLNLMQSIVEKTAADGTKTYIYTDENGAETELSYSSKDSKWGVTAYVDSDDNTLLFNSMTNELTSGDNVYKFDESGRLIRISDSHYSAMNINYSQDRIASVTDGAGRTFNFDYDADGFLTSITAPDSSTVLYAYNSEGDLAEVTYHDGRKASISYASHYPTEVALADAEGNVVYKVVYTYSNTRVASATEYGVENGTLVMGAKSDYTYSIAAGRTVVETTELADEPDTEDNIIKTVYTFDADGQVISEYMYSEDVGKTAVQGEGSGIHPYSGDGGAGVVSNINNLLRNHRLSDLCHWETTGINAENIGTVFHSGDNYSKFGYNYLRLTCYSDDCYESGLSQSTMVLPKGQWTFSVYACVMQDFCCADNRGVYIRVVTDDGTILAESERLYAYDPNYVRLIAPFELSSDMSVKVQILMDGSGCAYIDAPQLENNPYANAYNMLENGNFELPDGWSMSSGVGYSTDDCFNMSRSLKVSGTLLSKRYAYQTVDAKKYRSTRETFTLSGWAKGCGLPTNERDGVDTPTFRLKAEIKYSDSQYNDFDTETFTADFSPCTDEWQFTSVQFTKSKYRAVEYIRVWCEYDYNYGTAYFDDIQLVCDSVETNLSASDFDNEPAETEEVETTAETTASQDTSGETEFKEWIDTYGNARTETTFTDGEFGTIYRGFKFNEKDDVCPFENAGNDLIRETDARGNKTYYTVDAVTSRNEEVTDRCGNKTSYEYDESGRTTKVTSLKPKRDENGQIITDEQGNILYEEIADVSYTYDAFDNMTEIVRGDGMKYVLKYNAFHDLESIGVNGKTDGDLIKYTYKTGNGRLKEMTYANGDKMKATYNGIGQMVAEKWFDKNGNRTAYYKYVYDGKGNIVRSIDITAKKDYTYTYENEKIVRATECNITVDDNEFIIAKSVVNTIKYYYDSEDKLIKKIITDKSGKLQVIFYENNEDNTVVKLFVDNKYITSHSKTDSFGRKEFDELQLGTGFVSRQFSYHAGEVTDEHEYSQNLKSSPTTQLVSQIALSGGRTISYEYDAEERITKVTDSVDGTTEYTYDALGQLLTEKVTKDGVTSVVNEMTYDNYGNIRTKNGVEYTYGDENWKDLLTSYNGQSITYDAQGNPTSYLGHNLTWEKGRQLKSFDDIQYTYNANGIRTSKTVDNVRHTFVLDGAKILREEWQDNTLVPCKDNTLVPLYDNEESVCGIVYNDEPYYFLKNLQGDVIAIVDRNADTVARYSYDAWGVCSIAQDSSNCQIATINPYRYRGYYFDEEIGLYYVSSRYYDPEIGRFLNSDDVDYLGLGGIISNNLFVYCENNAVNNSDPDGYAPFLGWGVQLEGSFMGISGGIELVWYKSIAKSLYGNRNLPCVYGYGGFSYNFKGGNVWNIKSLIKYVKDTALRAFGSAKKAAWKIGGSLSLCAFLVYGTINHPKKYTGPFITTGATLFHIKAYYSRSPKGDVYCWGLGISSSKFGFSPLSVSGYAMVPANVIISIANWFSSLFGKIKAITNLI